MSAAQPSTVVVITFDCWPWPALGCYGHEWIDTPSWDHFAADGFLFDRCVATIEQDDRANILPEWLTRLHLAGIQTVQLRESGASRLGADAAWHEVREISGDSTDQAPLAERPYAKLAQAAIVELQRPATTPRLIWIHGAGLPDPCPILRPALELYAADFAAEGLAIAAMADADLVHHELTRATLLSVLDHWLGEILAAAKLLPSQKRISVSAWHGVIWEPPNRQTPLLGPFDPQAIQVPWIIAGEDILPGRTSALVTTGDLFPTIADWFGLLSSDTKSLMPLVRGDVESIHSEVTMRNGHTGSMWTQDDLTLFQASEVEQGGWAAQRYLWPEDNYAVHDVAAQTPDIVAERMAHFMANVVR